MTQAAVRDMLSGGVTEGVVVNIASLAAKTGTRGHCSYVASKAGIVGLTKTVALDLADKGIRCNAVLPGLTDTPATRLLTEQMRQRILARIPFARSAQPREIADVVAFLCSPESSYMTGAAVEDHSLRGHLAVVTGGGGNIGKAICDVLAEKGAHVIVADIDLAKAEAVLTTLSAARDGQKHVAMQVDIANSTSVQNLFASIKEVHGAPVSILVNCAAIFGICTSILDTSEESFYRVVDVNLKGTFLMTQAAARDMLAGEVTQGVVVNISSMAAKTGVKGRCGYVASKAGIVGLTKTVALDLADKGIRCNAVLPGMVHSLVPRVSGFFTEKQRQEISSRLPLGRSAQPREVADVVAFLCSPESSYMTGTSIEVAGGFNL
ncbi:unnamed protein product [Ixodes pacificus]